MRIFSTAKPVIGMIHLPALPGSPRQAMHMNGIRDWMLRDVGALVDGGIDGLILENYNDSPFFPGSVPPHTIAHMSVLAREVKTRFPLPLGINALRNDGIGSLAVAAASGAEFIRVNVYTGARLTDQGIVQGEAHKILRSRKVLGASVHIFADVAVKHSAPLGPRSLEEEVEDTVQRAAADAIIISGSATGKAVSVEELRCAKGAAGTAPVFAGSGVEQSHLHEVLQYADGLIVGTAFKRDLVVTNPVDSKRVREFMRAVAEVRGQAGAVAAPPYSQ